MTHDDNNIKDIYSLDDELLDALDGMKDTQEPATELPDDDRTDARLTDILALAAAADCSRRNDDVEQRLQKMLTHYAGKGQCGDAQTDGERQKDGDNGGRRRVWMMRVAMAAAACAALLTVMTMWRENSGAETAETPQPVLFSIAQPEADVTVKAEDGERIAAEVTDDDEE